MIGGLGRLVWLALALAGLAGAWWLPLGSEVEPVIEHGDLGSKVFVKLEPGQNYERDFTVGEQVLKGVRLYGSEDTEISGEVRLKIYQGEEELAVGRTVRWSRRSDSSHLNFPINLATQQKTKLTLVLEKISGPPLLIQVAEESNWLAMALVHPALLDTGVRQGVMIGVAFMVALVGLSIVKKNKWWWALLLIAVAVPMALAGFWFATGELGISDWDYYFSVHENYRRIILSGIFPHWNPYTCGGTAGLADPEFPIFSPLYILELVFGVSVGLRLALLISVTVGALGMLALAKRLKLSVEAGILAAIGWALGSATLLKFVEGHIDMLAWMWITWVLWAWLAAYRHQNPKTQLPIPNQTPNRNDQRMVQTERRIENWSLKIGHWQLICGLFLALIFLQGGLHILIYLSPGLFALSLLARDKKKALSITLMTGLWAVGLSAVKLVPVLFWVRQFPDQAYALSTFTLPYWYEIFLGRHLHGAQVLPNQGGGWHEYGAYLGPVILALAILGVTTWRRSRMVKGLVLAAVGLVLLSSAGPYLAPVLDMLPWIPRSYTSRAVVLAVLPLVLLAGVGLDGLLASSRSGRIKMLRYLIVGIVAVDLMSLAYPLSEQAFALPAVERPLPPATAPVQFTRVTHKTRLNGNDYDRTYGATRQGYGTLSYCSVLSPDIAVKAVGEEGERYVDVIGNSEPGQVINWSANKVSVDSVGLSGQLITINTNYANGWRVNGRAARNIEGRVGAKVRDDEDILNFEYQAPGFRLGLLIFSATVLAAAYRWRRGRLGPR